MTAECMIAQLRKLEKDHENDFYATGKIRWKDVCRDVADKLEELTNNEVRKYDEFMIANSFIPLDGDRKQTVVFDFDGVIHSYTSGWKGFENIPDPPVEGIKEVINTLRKQYLIVVITTRAVKLDGLRAVERWLEENNIKVDFVTAIKVPAIAYIDDRAIRVNNLNVLKIPEMIEDILCE